MAAPATAVLLTVGNEIVSGDVENTNASWLARRLAALGVSVRLIACVRDEIEEVAAFLRAEGPESDVVIVTGGLGGTPDDLTREAVAAAFGVPTVEQEPLAAELRERFATRGWASTQPAGPACRAAPRRSTTRSAARPGSWSGTCTSCRASERDAGDVRRADRFAGGAPIASWRRRYRTTEGQIVAVLEEATGRFAAVSVGSYPRFTADGPEVDVVLKSTDEAALAEAVAWVEEALP